MQKNQHQRTVILFTVIAVLMFGFGFALVPLYNVFCNTFGFNGRNAAIDNGTYNPLVEAARVLKEGVDTTRTVTVQFVANENKDLPWEFRPMSGAVDVHPGAVTQVRFYAKNLSDKTVVARAVPSMQPSRAVKYFTKMECFCFNNQVFKPGEAKEMPLIFIVNRNLPKGIDKLTQAYTFFDTKLSAETVADVKAIQPAAPRS
jgi:cytochrome c oxidase assembly protein subunit 11